MEITTYSCSSNLRYILGLILFVLAGFMAFNAKLELAGVCLLLIFSASTMIQTILSLKTRWITTNVFTWLQVGTIWGPVFASVLTLIAAAFLTDIFMTRTRLARHYNAELDFGNQETRKNSVKKMIIAALVFIQITLIISIPEIINFIQTLFKKSIDTEYIGIVFTLISVGISIAVLTETGRMKQYLSH